VTDEELFDIVSDAVVDARRTGGNMKVFYRAIAERAAAHERETCAKQVERLMKKLSTSIREREEM